jgi:hypothetical protein
MANVLRLSGTGAYQDEVVGESHYQKDLKRLAGKERRKNVAARLTCEDDNPYDKKAVRVSIEGKTVGYLPKEEARPYRQQLAAMGQAGATVECEAVIVTGKDGACGVYLDLPFVDDEDDDPIVKPIPAATQNPRAARPFVRRYFVLLSIGALVLLLSGAGTPIGVVLAAYLVYYRMKKWQ